jgi:mannose-1-phosphate guanylyltransferase / mannose-6-phosphate isomerase
MLIVPVLLSGGIGSRLWPLSRAATPKQLRSVLGRHTMVQATALRVAEMDGVTDPIVVCGASHGDPIRTQLGEIGVTPATVICEPVGRNTAAAVLLAALAAPDDAMLLVLPADHVVTDVAGFRDAVALAANPVSAGALVTFGVVPTGPETGFGYIRASDVEAVVRPVEAFVEKPDLATAESYVASGRYLWNSGMFAFRADAVRAEIERLAPEVYAAVSASVEGGLDGEEVRPGPAFLECPSISFDHAVMEHTDRAVVIPLDVGWSDVGSWATLWEIDDKDGDGNVVRGDAVLIGSTNSYVRTDGRLVALIGLDDVVVVDTGDAVLVAARDRVQDVKAVVERLAGRPELD